MRRWCGRPRTSRRSAGARPQRDLRRRALLPGGRPIAACSSRSSRLAGPPPSSASSPSETPSLPSTTSRRDPAPRPARPPRAPGSAHARAAGQVPSEPGADVQAFIPPPPSRTDWTRLVPPPVLTGHASARTCRRSSARGCAGPRGSPVVLTLLKGAGAVRRLRHPPPRPAPPQPPPPLPTVGPYPCPLLYTHSLPLEQVQLRRTHLFGATAMRPRLAAPDSALGAPGNRPPPAPPPRRRHSRLSRLSVARKLAGDATQPASLRVRMRA